MGYYCSYGLCNSSSEKEPHLKFVPFPKPTKNLKAAKTWLQLIGRDKFGIQDITRNTYVCEKHFALDAVLDLKRNPDLKPNPARGQQLNFPSIHSRRSAKPKSRVDDTKQSNASASQSSSTPTNTTESPEFKLKRPSASKEITYSKPVKVKRNIEISWVLPPPQRTPTKINQPGEVETPKKPVDVACQVDVPKSRVVQSLEKRIKELEQQLQQKKSIAGFILENEKKAKYYTGLTKEARQSLWDFLGEAKYHLKIFDTKKKISGKLKKATVEDQFLLTLFKLRCNYTYQDLSFRHGINPRFLSKIIKTWMQFIYLKHKAMEDRMFTTYQDLPKPPPKAFNNSLLKESRVSVDCSELFIESTTDFEAQGNRFSSYKHHATAKVLIGVAPSGGFMYASHCYEGAVSDRAITDHSGFLDHINPNDLILADRGFNIEDLLAQKGARLNIPPFLKGRPNFTLSETRKTKLIARARIHIERFNQRFKRWRFLKGIIPQCHFCILSQAVYICCCLSNYDRPLCK